ncbi:hypothetical protein EfmGK923_06700 [Enterococcus faecium]|nr:hypothetical protein EfmGK923_06700 [Enterococcus faecium]
MTGQRTPDVIIGRAERTFSCSVSTLYRRFKTGEFNVLHLPMQGKRKPNGYKEKRGKQVKASGITNYKTVFITPFDHAYFYPEATRLNLKLIFDADSGRILGGQAFGEKGVDKRMGELSVAITGNLTVFDLPDLELPYSPPYSTTRDPLNIAGYVAINQMTNIVETIKASDD